MLGAARFAGRVRKAAFARFRPCRQADGPPMEVSPQADWAWRPGPWRAALDPAEHDTAARRTMLGPGMALHHDDGGGGRVRLVQTAPAAPDAPFAVTLAPELVAASFVSLTFDLPADASPGMDPHSLVHAVVRMAPPPRGGTWVRLTLVGGPNAASQTRPLTPADDALRATVDMAMLDRAVFPTDRAWVDLILDPPEGPVRVADLYLTREPRPPALTPRTP